ncbi:MAG: phage baseplate assembly protein [Blastococcus sp.]|jgi:phage baseplate assembly protein W|nr:phage baseplate assembly protein [Blastococcus sp.]
MAGEFLGRGWAFPIALDERGAIAGTALEDAVRQAIWVVLSTAPGERVMRPTFGAGLADLVFAPNTPATHGLVASAVRDALVEWEPRIDVLDVAVTADPGQPTRLLVEVDYSVRATNSRFNLVYPFYLQQPA